MNENEIIHISSIILHFHGFLHPCVKLVHIDIGKELTRQIPDRESTSWTSIEETLAPRESDPVFFFSDYFHIFSHIGTDNGTDEIERDILFIWREISHDEYLYLAPQYLPIDTHEKS